MPPSRAASRRPANAGHGAGGVGGGASGRRKRCERKPYKKTRGAETSPEAGERGGLFSVVVIFVVVIV